MYDHWRVIRDDLEIQGLGGLAQAVFSGVLVAVETALREAGGPVLPPLLEEIRSTEISPEQRTKTTPYERVEEVLLEHVVHRLGSPRGRQREVGRRILRDLTHAEAAGQLGIDFSTHESHLVRLVRRCRRGLGKSPNVDKENEKRRRVLDVADACFLLFMTELDAKLAEMVRGLDLAAALEHVRCEPPQDPGVGEVDACVSSTNSRVSRQSLA